MVDVHTHEDSLPCVAEFITETILFLDLIKEVGGMGASRLLEDGYDLYLLNQPPSSSHGVIVDTIAYTIT